ncbi:DnaJ family domain-containing protein [Monashia sp. NPDC004114]
MSSQPYWESAVERQIREAQERGDFDDLPGAGKPLDLSDSSDPDWWVKRMAKRENLDFTGALPGALGLRKEAAGYPDALADVRTEKQVREIITDYNKRVLADRLRPAVGNLPPLLAKTIDVDEMVEQWRGLRAERDEQARTAAEEAARAAAAERAANQRMPWWRKLFAHD